MVAHETISVARESGVTQAQEGRAFWWMGQQPDAAEGVTSFLEKRKPEWKQSKRAELTFDARGSA